MIPPIHVELRQRKALVLRLGYARFIQPVLPILGAQSQEHVATQVRDLLYLQAAGALDRPNDDQPLDRFLSECAEQLRDLLALLERSPGVPRELGDAFNQFQSEALSVACAVCSGHAQVCNGTEADNSFVNGAGLCMREILTLADVAASRAVSIYQDAGLDEARASDIVFSTGYASLVGSRTGSEHGVGGVTNFHADDGRHYSEVRLLLAVDRFDELSWASLPTVLYHEAICHGFEGRLGAHGRCNNEPNDMFSEGWMDWLALRALQLDLEHDPLHFPHDAARQAHAIQAIREGAAPPSVGTKPKDLAAAARTVGRIAAERLFRAIRVSVSQPDTAMSRLSASLNLLRSPGDSSDYQSFVLAVYGVGGRPRLRGRLAELCSQYLQSRDRAVLFKEAGKLNAEPPQ